MPRRRPRHWVASLELARAGVQGPTPVQTMAALRQASVANGAGGCPHGLPPPDRCTCGVMLTMSGVGAGLLALGLYGVGLAGDQPQATECTVTAVVVGGCRYDCNCRTVCGALQTPCGPPSREDTRRRITVCDSCAGHKYLYVAQTPDCESYGVFSSLLAKRAGAMEVTGGAGALAGVEPGLLDYRQSEDPAMWACAAEAVYSVGDLVSGCEMLSCDAGEFCDAGGACHAGRDTGASVFGLILGAIFALIALSQLVCIARWQLLRVCGRLPPEALEAARAADRAEIGPVVATVIAVKPLGTAVNP
jgi:hypothetical protein